MNSIVAQQHLRWAGSARRPLVILCPVLLLMSCAVGPNYKRPNVASPPAFRGGPEVPQQASLADLPWWDIFHDERLTGLIKESLANNYDLTVAVARIDQANEVAAQA